MPSFRCLALLLCLVSTSGCYFYFHPPSNRARPKVIPGAEIDLESKETTEKVTCRDDDLSRSCRIDNTKRYHFTKYTATYGGKKLTEGELLALVSPRYNADWDRIESKKKLCKLSLVPTALSMTALFVAGGLSIYGSSKYGKIDEWPSGTRDATYAVTGATIGLAAVSYVAGGFACVTAHRIGIGLGTKYHGDEDIRVGNRNHRWNEAKIQELKKVVRDFNAKARAGGRATPPPVEEPAEEP